MKKFLKGALLTMALIPTIVSAKTITCTSKGNFVEGKNVYDSISVSCTDGKVNPFSICEVESSFYYEDIGMSSCNVVNPYNAVAGKKYVYSFELILKDFNEEDKLIIDGDDSWTMIAKTGGCYSEWDGEEMGCTVSTKKYTASGAPSPSPSTTPSASPEPSTTPSNSPEPTNKVINVYWVSYDVNGGKEEIKQEAVEEGKTATKPTDPTRDGYKFVEWQLDGKKYDFNKEISKSIKLVAKWEEDTTGKKNISFVKLTGLAAPYEGDFLDTSVTIKTYTKWTIDLFNVNMKWYRGKDKNKITEEIYGADKHKVEAGYYYKLVITLTPGNGYTFNNTRVTVSGKTTTYIKNENSLVLAEKVYGPIVKGQKADPLLTIEDYYDTVGGGDETHFNVHANMIKHDPDADSVSLGANCIRVTNTRDFEISSEICGTDEVNTNYSRMYMKNDLKPLATLTLKKAVPGNTYTTDIILTDTKGRTYTATYSLQAVSHGKVTVGKEGDPVIAEFLGEAEKNWYVHVESIKDTNTYLPPENNLNLNELGNFIDIQNITVTSEEGERKNGTFTIKIKLTEELKKYGSFTFVYVVGGDGYEYSTTEEKVTGHIEGDYLVAKLPHLSNYAIFGKEETKENKKDNNLNLYILIAGGVCAVAGITISVIALKKSKKKDK